MTDENHPRSIGDGMGDGIGAEDQRAVEQILAGLDFLRPDGPEADGPMPEWAWARISAALAAEAPATHQTDRPRRSRVARWGGGLVAASVAVIAVGVGVTAFQGGGSGGVVVADGDPAVGVAAFAEAAPAGGGATLAATPKVLTPEGLSFAGVSQMLVDSDTDYTAAGLRSQVRKVLAGFGVGDGTDAGRMMTTPGPLQVEQMPVDGFTSDATALRDCIASLLHDARATALMVDRSTYDGQEAGVVVAPDGVGASGGVGAFDEQGMTVPDLTELRVWVVDEDCDILVQGFSLSMAP